MGKIAKKVVFALWAIIFLALLLELLAKLTLSIALKDKIDAKSIASEFEEIYVPPFETKQAQDFWIFVYGGSSVQGIPLPKTGFVNQLQYQANRVFEGKNIKVFNLGWAGFNSTRIRYLLERTIDQKPDLVIIYTGENEFIYPQLDFYWLVKATTVIKNRTNLGKLVMAAVKSKASTDESSFSSSEKFPAYAESTFMAGAKKRIFENNLEAIVETTKTRGVPLVLGIPAHNIADWPPVRRELTTAKTPKGYTETVLKISALVKNENIEEAAILVDKSLTEFKNDASLLFLKATIEKRSKKDSKAIFEKVLDYDLVPWRTTSKNRDYIKSLEDRSTVWVIDFAQVLAANSKNGLVGFDFILDGTHPTKEGAYAISSQIILFLKEQQLVNPVWIKESKNLYAQEELFEKMDLKPQDDFITYLKTAHLSLKIPFTNLDTAKYYILKAQEINSQNWEIKATLAIIAHLEGEDDLSKTYLKEAEDIKDGKITKDEVKHIPYLSQILTD